MPRRAGARAGGWALPGRFRRERETLADAVERTLEDKCHLNSGDLAGRMPRQLHVFDDPDRDDRGWVLSIAHPLVLPFERLLGTGTVASLLPNPGASAKK